MLKSRLSSKESWAAGSFWEEVAAGMIDESRLFRICRWHVLGRPIPIEDEKKKERDQL